MAVFTLRRGLFLKGSSCTLLSSIHGFNAVPRFPLPYLPSFPNTRALILDSASECVSLTPLSGIDEGIVDVKLERPHVKNAIGMEMLRGFKTVFESIHMMPCTRAVVISSSIPLAFCAGADLKERKKMTEAEVQFFANSLRSAFSSLASLPVPTIAAIEGPALGGGLELALACDIRICGEDAILGLPETGLAIIPGAGGTQRLPRLVGNSKAKELIFTGRKLNGKDAESIGLVNHCVPAGEAYSKALEMAREIGHKGPLGIMMAKIAINKGSEKDMVTALKVEEECYAKLLPTKDRLEALIAFEDKRPPRYCGS